MDRLLPNGESPDHTMLGWKCKFTKEEDDKLKNLVENYPKLSWKDISVMMGSRTPRQCRERFKNYLANSLRHDKWTPSEDAVILEKYYAYGNKWNIIAKYLPGRTGNSIRNRCQFLLKKKNQTLNINERKHAATRLTKKPTDANPDPAAMPDKPQESSPEEDEVAHIIKNLFESSLDHIFKDKSDTDLELFEL